MGIHGELLPQRSSSPFDANYAELGGLYKDESMLFKCQKRSSKTCAVLFTWSMVCLWVVRWHASHAKRDKRTCVSLSDWSLKAFPCHPFGNLYKSDCSLKGFPCHTFGNLYKAISHPSQHDYVIVRFFIFIFLNWDGFKLHLV